MKKQTAAWILMIALSAAGSVQVSADPLVLKTPGSAEETVSESGEDISADSAAESAEEGAADAEDPEMAMLMSLPLTEGEYTTADCIELGEYKGLKLTRPSSEVTDDEVETAVRSSVMPEEVGDEDAVVQDGDTARIAFEGKKDGVPFEGGTSESYDLVIGSGSFIDGFEDGVTGMKKGETKDIDLTFPEDYPKEDLAGEDVVFTVTVNAILRTPELSDEWAAGQEDGQYATLEEYLAAQKKQMEEANEEMIIQDLQADAWLEAQKASTFLQLPSGIVEQGKDEFEDSVIEEASVYGMDLEAYLQAVGATKEEYDTRKEQYGRYAAMSRVLLDALVEAEGLSEDSEEYKEELQKLCDSLGVTEDQLFEEHEKEMIDQYLLTQVAANRIISYADVTVE